MVNDGVLVGVEQNLAFSPSLNIAQFGTEVKVHLFIHLIAKELLVSG